MRLRLRCLRLPGLSLLSVAMSCALPCASDAHVKWFCGPVDVRTPPLALHALLSPTFLLCLAGFAILVATGAFADAWLAGRGRAAIAARSPRRATLEEGVIRLALAAFLLLLWDVAAAVPWSRGVGAVLTPELLDGDRVVALVQIATAAMLVLRCTCPLAGLGLAALYGIGVARYGVFHMLDYGFFLGLALYLGLSAPPAPARLRPWRVPVLAASLSFSLMWTAVEKFLYPLWTALVVQAHPSIAFGFPAPFATVVAGFVEFSLAFYLLAGCRLLRIDALVIVLILLAAVPEFGALDEVGHLPILAILAVIVLHGPTRLQNGMAGAASRPGLAAPALKAARIAGLYCAALAIMVALYYAMQRTTLWA